MKCIIWYWIVNHSNSIFWWLCKIAKVIWDEHIFSHRRKCSQWVVKIFVLFKIIFKPSVLYCFYWSIWLVVTIIQYFRSNTITEGVSLKSTHIKKCCQWYDISPWTMNMQYTILYSCFNYVCINRLNKNLRVEKI